MRQLAFALLTSLLCGQLPQDPARIQTFEAIPKTATLGEPVELRWSATGADQVRLEPLDQDFPAVGHVLYVPRERTVFWLHVSNFWGGQSVPLIVELLPQEVPSLPAQRDRNEGAQVPVAEASPGGIWIQFAALADPGSSERLSRELSRRIGSKVMRFDIKDPGHPEQTLQRLRLGPFPSVRSARKRLRGLQSRLKSLHLQPIVAVN